MRALLIAGLLVCGSPSGSWTTLRMGDEEIEVYRDDWGIPHIFAKSVAGAFWAEGYAEAQDRLWQMETFRRAAKGESAEIFGEKSLAADLERRRTGYTEAELRKMFDSASERTRSILAAYTAGVNAFLKQGKLSPPFAEFKCAPRPWTETDCVAVGVMMARRYGESGGLELQLLAVYNQLESTLGREKASKVFDNLLRGSNPRAPTTLNDQERPPTPPAPKDDKHDFVPLDLQWYAAVRREHEDALAALEAIGAPAYGGSNAWVVGPKKSASGHAILYGGPMMGFNSPSLCDEIHLVAPGLDVAGMSFAGFPGVMIGFNETLAWTTTSGGADVVDIYRLELHPDHDDEYRWNGGWKKFDSFEVEIKIAGQPPRKETIRRSRYGPLAGTPDTKNRRAYTQAMSFWMQEGSGFDAMLDFNFAGSVEEFRKSVSKIKTSHNFFAADRDGHIGFWYCGAHPIRKKDHDPRLPQKGDGSMDWEGILPFEKWPQAVDPPGGFFANWNNKPARSWEPSIFGAVFWGKKIVDTLDRNEKVTFEQVQGIARETAYHSYLADYFVPHILAAAKDDKGEKVVKAVEILSKWDHMKRPGEPGPVLVERWVRGMMRRIFGDELGLFLTQREVERVLADPLLSMLENNGAITYDFAGGANLKAMSLAVFRDMLKDGLEKLAWEEDAVNFKGKAGKVKSERGRGTFQMTVELTPEGPRAATLAAPGQCEDPDSPHHADQLDLFKAWKLKPFVFRRAEMK